MWDSGGPDSPCSHTYMGGYQAPVFPFLLPRPLRRKPAEIHTSSHLSFLPPSLSFLSPFCLPPPQGKATGRESPDNQIPLAIKVRFPVLLSDSQAGKPDMGLRTVTKVVELLLVLLFSSLWVTHPVGKGFDFIIIVSLLSSHCSFFFSLCMG